MSDVVSKGTDFLEFKKFVLEWAKEQEGGTSQAKDHHDGNKDMLKVRICAFWNSI